ncbi:hypothetical protein BX616_002529 [Lobosporangium transversale]|nr:hypothetical protein BX616_002529 [Lobosporangium transversale]
MTITTTIPASSFPVTNIKDVSTSPQNQIDAYPSPSHSPTSVSSVGTVAKHQLQPTTFDRRRSSVKALLNSPNPPASPLDALVMALEATVEEEEAGLERFSTKIEDDAMTTTGAAVTAGAEDEEEDDPDATIPSSPTMFMKRPASATGPSLHHLPSMMLPESAASSVARSHSASSLTPSTLPRESLAQHSSNQRKMSISSQDSSSSFASNGERTKEYACTIENCKKKFFQISHLRSHER